MQKKRHDGGGAHCYPCLSHKHHLRPDPSCHECWKHFGVDGPVARAEERRVRELEARHSAASFLSNGLSRGFAGTRIA